MYDKTIICIYLFSYLFIYSFIYLFLFVSLFIYLFVGHLKVQKVQKCIFVGIDAQRGYVGVSFLFFQK